MAKHEEWRRPTKREGIGTWAAAQRIKDECEAIGARCEVRELADGQWFVAVDTSTVETMHVNDFNIRMKGIG